MWGWYSNTDIYMWQPQIEIEYYSVVYLERITKFDARYSAELPLRAGLIRAS